MKKRSKLKKGLAILLSLAMVVGLVPGVGTMKVSAAESSTTEETGTAAGITYTPLDGDPEGYSGEAYSNLLDGTAETKWCCGFTNPSYVIFKTSEPVYVKGYSIWTANDTASESGRNPVAWTLSGCNDYNETNKTGGTWVTIHEVTGAKTEDALPAANKTEKSYSFAESGYSYQYFKLNITGIKSGTTMQLGDFSLTCGACKHQWVKTETTIPPTCTEGGYDVERCSLCQATRNVANNVPATGHDFGENGLCTRCGASDTTPSKPNGEGTEQSPYQISTVGELNWFAGLVNGTLDGVTQNTSAYAVLATDINFGDNSFVAIGTETYPFSGTFDGSGHTITVNQSESTDVALFGFLGNSTVKNLTVTGTINTTTTKFAAGIAMQTKTGTTATVENCISDVTIESNISGDGTHAGLIGVPNGAVNINNCAFTGAINGASTNACGGMIGFAKGKVTIKNSYIAATFSLDETECHTFSRNFVEWVTLENCYYLNALGDVPASATQLTDEQFSSGEAAYLLQGDQTEAVWGQNIDNDQTKQNYPVLGGAKVYGNITYQCPGSRKVDNTEYSNTEKDAAYGEHAMQKFEAKAPTCTEDGNPEYWICSYEEGVYYKEENGKNTYDTVVIPATGHSFGEDGICTNKDCSISNETVAKPAGEGTESSPYQISTAGELYWFAGLVNGDTSVCTNGVSQNKSAVAVLIADITVNKNVLDADGNLTGNTGSFKSWTPIGKYINGNEDIMYTGTFDGKGYTISGLYFAGSTTSTTSTSRLGFFGYVGSGGSVSNVGIVDSYFSGGINAGGVCGVNYGSVTNCYHTGVVSGTIYVGGVCGVNYGSITNCYHTGAVSGSNTGGVCGVNDSSGNITNCYYETMDGIAGGIKGSDVTGKAQGKAKEAFNEGVVAYLLSHGSIDGSIWGQTLTEEDQQDYPVLGGPKVYLKGTYTGCECNPGEPTSTDGYSNNKEDTVYSEHTMTAHSANNATCTKDGNLAYWTCSNGEGLYYKDEAGTEKYNNYEDDIKLPATGHTDEDLDGKCDTCSKYMDNIGARLVGHSLTLDGSVGVNFYMELSSEVISDSNAYMEFTLPGGKTSTVKVSEAPTEVISGTTYYKFKCQVNATAMTDTITAQIKSTVGNSKVYEYTVKEYADYLFAHKDESTEFAEAAELIEAMVNYGSYAQIYAGYNTENLAVGDAKNLKSLDDVWISRYYEPSPYETKVQFAGANLSLLSTTTLRMYFKITDIDAESVLIGYQGQALEKTQSGDYYYVELVGIPASKLDDEFCIDVGDGSTNFVVTYTPMAYCTSVVHRETTETRTEDLKNLIKALVLYNRAADAYISEN